MKKNVWLLKINLKAEKIEIVALDVLSSKFISMRVYGTKMPRQMKNSHMFTCYLNPYIRSKQRALNYVQIRIMIARVC